MQTLYYFVLATIIMALFVYFDRFWHKNIRAIKSLIMHALWIIITFASFSLLLFIDYKKTNWMYLGIPVSLIGLLLMVLAAIELKKKIIISNEMVSSGIYSYIRHPLYLGTIFIFLGFSISAGSSYGLIYTMLSVILFYNLAKHDEDELTKKFKKYKQYMLKTKMFIPKII